MIYTKKHSKNGNLYGAVLIQETDLLSFVEFLSKHFNEININGKTIDGTNINFSNLEEFTSYSNFEKRKIVEFELSCSNEEQSIDIKFQNDRYLIKPETISYYLRYNNHVWGFKFEDDLRQELKEFRPYYNFLSYINLKLGVPAIFLVLSSLLFSIDYLLKVADLPGFTNIDYYNSGRNNSSWITQIPFLASLFLLGYIMELIRNYLFPVLFIATGKQKKEYQKRKKIIYVVFGIIILGIIINLVSYFITIKSFS